MLGREDDDEKELEVFLCEIKSLSVAIVKKRQVVRPILFAEFSLESCSRVPGI